MSGTAFVAEFKNKESAEAAAKVRNAVLLEWSGEARVNKITDYKDEKPISFEWRDLIGNAIPWPMVMNYSKKNKKKRRKE